MTQNQWFLLTISLDVDFQELDEWVGNLDLGLLGLKIRVVGLH